MPSRSVGADAADGTLADAGGQILAASAAEGDPNNSAPSPAIPEDPGITAQRLAMQQRVVELMHQRRQDAVAFLIAGHPNLGQAWSQAETFGSAADLSAAIRLTASLADLDGIPGSERRTLSAPYLAKAMQVFAEDRKSVV